MNALVKKFFAFKSGESVARREIPTLETQDFLAEILSRVKEGERVAAYFGVADKKPGTTRLWVILADDRGNQLHGAQTSVEGPTFPSITEECPQVHLFEREIAEQFGLIPTGHPWLKPVRYHPSWTDVDAWGRSSEKNIPPAVGDFYKVEGEQIHEVAVGPVHAGIIEPGHFRFQCNGEKVLHLEIALGFQHRGVEQSLGNGPNPRSLHYAENLSGDSAVAHATNYCQNLESLSSASVSARAQVVRGVALELERLANHIGDIGALSGDVGFLPTASFCGRIRGDVLNMTAVICGNRFGRSLVRPGGIVYDLDDRLREDLLKRLAVSWKDASQAINLLWDNQSVMERFEEVGVLSKETALELGIVGPAARASGLPRDVRFHQSSGIYRFSQVPISTYESGDVFGRAYVRWMEIQQSFQFVKDQLESLPGGTFYNPIADPLPGRLSVSLNEGWRGEVCHVVLTGDDGKFERYKMVDPSFHNWSGLAHCLRGQEISDFPICNKSFGLSYCGHDL